MTRDDETHNFTEADLAHLGEGHVAYLREMDGEELKGKFPGLAEDRARHEALGAVCCQRPADPAVGCARARHRRRLRERSHARQHPLTANAISTKGAAPERPFCETKFSSLQIQAAFDPCVSDSSAWIAAASLVPRTLATVSPSRSTRAILRQRLEVIGAGAFGREQQEHQIDRLVVQRLEIDRRVELSRRHR